MIKRMFFGFAVFVALFTLVAWQYAMDELAEIQDQPELAVEESTAEAA